MTAGKTNPFYISKTKETSLKHNPTFSDAEIEYLVKNEAVFRLEDIVNRRTNLAFTGSLSVPLLEELSAIAGKTLGWNSKKQELEVAGIHLEIGGKK